MEIDLICSFMIKKLFLFVINCGRWKHPVVAITWWRQVRVFPSIDFFCSEIRFENGCAKDSQWYQHDCQWYSGKERFLQVQVINPLMHLEYLLLANCWCVQCLAPLGRGTNGRVERNGIKLKCQSTRYRRERDPTTRRGKHDMIGRGGSLDSTLVPTTRGLLIYVHGIIIIMIVTVMITEWLDGYGCWFNSHNRTRRLSFVFGIVHQQWMNSSRSSERDSASWFYQSNSHGEMLKWKFPVISIGCKCSSGGGSGSGKSSWFSRVAGASISDRFIIGIAYQIV